MENKSLEQRMETEPVHRVILSLAAPTVLSMLVISAYSIVDTFFVTRLGSRATGAVGITFALVAWIQAVGYTVGMGAGSLVSRLLGKKEKEQAEQIAISAIMSGLLLGLISLGAGLDFFDTFAEAFRCNNRAASICKGICPLCIAVGTLYHRDTGTWYASSGTRQGESIHGRNGNRWNS